MRTVLYAAIAVAVIAAASQLVLTRTVEQSSTLAYSTEAVRL